MSESNPFQQSAADVNPYAAPMSNSVAQEGTNSEFEAIRREHLSH